MSLFRVFLSVIYTPLAVLNRGFGSMLIVFVLCVFGCLPVVNTGLVILNNPKKQ